MYEVLERTGKMLRFAVDDYFRLQPDLMRDFHFFGDCPQTGKSRGIVVNEYLESIELPFLDKEFIGVRGFRTFANRFIARNELSPREKRATSDSEAARINSRLRDIFAKVKAEAFLLTEENFNLQKLFTDQNREVVIEFHLHQSHRLFHPGSDNILCAYTSPFEILLETDEPQEKICFENTFAHSHLFHELIDHKGVALADLVQVDFIWVDYKYTFQSQFRGLRAEHKLSLADPK